MPHTAQPWGRPIQNDQPLLRIVPIRHRPAYPLAISGLPPALYLPGVGQDGGAGVRSRAVRAPGRVLMWPSRMGSAAGGCRQVHAGLSSGGGSRLETESRVLIGQHAQGQTLDATSRINRFEGGVGLKDQSRRMDRSRGSRRRIKHGFETRANE